MNDLCDEWFDWYNEEATDAERYLFGRMDEFGEMFGDMLFEEGSASYDLISCKSRVQDTDSWGDDALSLPDPITFFTYENYRTKVEKTSDCDGYYDHENQTICLPPRLLQDDASILHEMIHLHERMLSELEPYFHDIMFWALYQDLRKKIPDLDEIISTHAHVLNEAQIYETGGAHDILFLLKSFDLDIRMGYPLGRVFAYGKEDAFKDYKYTQQPDG